MHLNSINNTMSYYKRYQKTIKEVAKKNYNRRIIWLNEFLAPYSCHHCGEPVKLCVLNFIPMIKKFVLNQND